MTAVPAPSQSIEVGDIRVTYLPDGVAYFSYDAFPDASDECWARHVSQTADGRWVCSIGGFLVESADRKVLVDLGYGSVQMEVPDFVRANSGMFLDNLSAAGVKPADVDTVVYTHMHADHTGWTRSDGDLTFPNALHVAGPGEVEHWQLHSDEPFTPADHGTFASHVEESADGQLVAPGVTIVHNPGHTPGHQVVVVASGGSRAVLLGDTVHCAAQLSESEMTFIFDVDAVAARKWRNRWLEELESSGDLAGASHFSTAAFGRVLVGEGRRYWSPA
jgi:glyoxylase-like metal-dependent hydrolase (beta-lactamase superfamily II)